MLRVVHFIFKMDRGGIETLIMNLYRNIDRSKVQFDFAVHSKEKGDYDDEIKRLGGKIIYFPSFRNNPVKYMSEWRSFFRKNANYYNALHFHTPSLANIYPLKMAAKYNIPIRILHSHNTNFNRGRLQGLYNMIHEANKQKIDKFATDFFACSIPAAEWLFGNEMINKGHVVLMRNGIETEKFLFNSEKRSLIRKELCLEGKFVIGNVGRLTYQKNHEFLVDVFAEVYKKNNNAVLLLIGKGELEENIKEKVSDLGLTEAVKFLGVREDINSLFQAMDIFLFPSRYEGLGIVLIEAQASGLRGIASDVIPKDAKLTELIDFMSLNESKTKWADEVLKCEQGYERRNTKQDLVNCGYDIKMVASKYQEFLLSKG